MANLEKRSGLSFECLDTADDLHDLARNLRLTGSVVSSRQALDHVVRVLRRTLHSHHSSDLLADGRIQKALEQLNLKAVGTTSSSMLSAEGTNS